MSKMKRWDGGLIDRADYKTAAEVKDAAKAGKPVAKRKPGRPRTTADQPLTRKQELFVREMVANDGHITFRLAAERAGYPAKSAHARAYELMRHPAVQKALGEHREEMREKFGVTYEGHLQALAEIRDQALEAKSFSAAVQAEARRGMAKGDIYVSKSEIRTGSIDTMSKSEVLAALAEIKAGYDDGNTIDVTPARDGEADLENEVRVLPLARNAGGDPPVES
jgi:phage terminase small subunit|tara:strand:- start:863 stop:1531 length:669 start_codon:yes stop_codon:yes gene_type:complete